MEKHLNQAPPFPDGPLSRHRSRWPRDAVHREALRLLDPGASADAEKALCQGWSPRAINGDSGALSSVWPVMVPGRGGGRYLGAGLARGAPPPRGCWSRLGPVPPGVHEGQSPASPSPDGRGGSQDRGAVCAPSRGPAVTKTSPGFRGGFKSKERVSQAAKSRGVWGPGVRGPGVWMRPLSRVLLWREAPAASACSAGPGAELLHPELGEERGSLGDPCGCTGLDPAGRRWTLGG